MSSALDYEQIAHLYDSYLRFTDDVPFFLQFCQEIGGSVVELMCGTGRISLPLLKAGVNLTCVDASPTMLNILRQKLASQNLTAHLIEADVADLQLDSTFDLVLLPFQSFHELQTEVERQQTLHKIAQVLKPSGRFICTLHNPKIRLQSLDQGITHYGPFPLVDGTGSVRLSVEMLDYDTETGMVSGQQTISQFDEADQNVAEYRLPVQFSLIEFERFHELLQVAGFSIEEIFGNYDQSSFIPEKSPFIVVCCQKTP